MEKFKHKIDQEARKTLVLSQVANPKVSEIQNQNDEYLNQKNQKKLIDFARLSIEETDRREFEQKKKKMMEAMGPTPSLQLSEDTYRTGKD